MRKRTVIGLVLAGILLLPGSADAQVDSSPASHARKGMIIGGISGGVLGGLGVGVLAHGLCEYDCDTAFEAGFVIGLLGGGVVGGLVGLVVGAGIPRGSGTPSSGPSEPWSVGVGLGPRWADSGTIRGTDVWAGLVALRPTTSKIRWGFQLEYLGNDTHVDEFETLGREGDPIFFRNEWKRGIWNLSIAAERSSGRGFGPYLSASAGVYPFFESLHAIRTTTNPDPIFPGEVSERSSSVFPGVGLGGGGLWAAGDRASLGFDSKVHLILGAGNGSVLPILSAGVTLRRRGRGGA